MKKSELRSLIRECVCDALKEASYKSSDDEFIEDWVKEELSKNGKLALGDVAVEKAIDNIKEEWKEAASRFTTVRTYLMDLRKQGVFDELLESKITEATIDTINYTKAIKFFNQMKREYFEDEDAQEDFINEIATIAKQLGITEDVTNDDIIAGFLEDVQDVDVTSINMVKMLKNFLKELQ